MEFYITKMGSAVGKPVDVVIQPLGLRRRAERGQTLYEVIREAGIELTSICGGLGKCGKCRVVVTDGREAINRPTEVEQEHFSVQELLSSVRLACQIKVQGSIEVYVPRESVVTRIRLQSEGVETKVEPLPLVEKFYVELPKPTLQSLEPDLERLLRSLYEYNVQPSYISPEILRSLPETLRGAYWKVTTTVWNNKEILDVEKGNTSKACYGLAVDVGTTKIASYLVGLTTGETVAVSSMVNPQVSYGEDVITRVTYAMRGETERKELQRKVVEGINQLIAECCSNHGIDPRHIYEATVVGNTAMHHLLLGISPKYLALSPYVPAVKGPLNLKAKELDLDVNPHANVHFLPVIAGFVGSDCVADILATGLFKEKDLCLLLDIGTNTEVVVGNQKRMVACSCASGPAFEGAHIKHGMKASSGAIEGARIDSDTLEVSFRTIDNVEPRGLCGSGIVDIIAEMLKAGIIDERGTIKREADSPRVRINEEGEREFVVVQASPIDIVVTQADVREIQLAKGAIRTGITILMQKMGVTPEQIKRVYIAGAFGTYIDPASAKAIGMIPDIPLNIVTSVGNAAGTGARMVLVSSKAGKVSKKISDSVEYVELAAHPNFHSVFIESLRFPHRED
jgi:uncharacterized 2Fe-2S/4Fe-4S cluster protein (DUF4445 family)